ncbi:MAG: phosphoribosylglycinamide formyltransferase [Vampirovibrio sp.]|nr:phosphoribosylglycinamide formyltransferase [Vampirovibrio sp.]
MSTGDGERKCKLGVLLSGRGSNFQAIHQAIESGQLGNAEIALVISNKQQAPGLALAQSQGHTTVYLKPSAYPSKEEYDTAIVKALKGAEVDLVILAGYTRILTPVLITAFSKRILNIHPSLLPAYGGKGMVGGAVHHAVLEAGETQSGCTVHIVTEAVDEGPILGQQTVAVMPKDTPDTLAQRVLEQEHVLYPNIIGRYIKEQITEQIPF